MEARGPQSRGTRHKKMNVSENWSSSDDSSSSDGEESARIKEVVEESLGSMKGNICIPQAYKGPSFERL